MAISVQEILVRWKADLTQFAGAIKSVQSQLKSAGTAAADAGKAISMNLSAPMAAIGTMAYKLAGDFEGAVNKIVGLVGIPREQANAWKGDMKALAAETGKSGKEIGEALYYITSAGMRGSVAIDTLRASAQAAEAGLGGMESIADAATSAINAYGASNLSAEEAVGVLVATVREGKMASEELAGSLGRVLPIASQLGVSINEVGGVVAVLTRIGLDSAEAVTALRGAMGMLLRPSQQAEEYLARAGTSVAELRRKVRDEGLLETLQALAQAFKDDETAMATLFPNIRALTGVLGLTGSQAAKAREIMVALRAETGQSLVTAWKETESSGRELRRAIEGMKLALVELGEEIKPVIVPLFQEMTRLAKGTREAFKELSPEVQRTTAEIVLFAAALGPVVYAGGKVLTFLGAMLGSVKALAVGVAAAGSQIVFAFRAWAAGAGTLAEGLAMLGPAAKAGLVGLTALASYQFGKWLDEQVGITRSISENFRQVNPVKALAEEMAASQDVLDAQLSLLKRKIAKLPAEMGGGQQGLIGLDFLAANNLEGLAERIQEVNKLWAQFIASQNQPAAGGAGGDKKAGPAAGMLATFKDVKNQFENLRAELKKPWVDDATLAAGIAKMKAMLPVLAALAKRSADVEDAEAERRDQLEAIAELEAEVGKRTAERLDFELAKLQDYAAEQGVMYEQWGAFIARYDELTAAIIKQVAAQEGQFAAERKAYELEQRRLELERQHSPEIMKWLNALKLVDAENEAAAREEIKRLQEQQAAEDALTNQILAAADERSRRITDAWSSLMDSLRGIMAEGLTEGIFGFLEGKDAKESWERVWEGFGNVAKSRLSGILGDLMSGKGWKESLQNAGILDQSGKGINWGGLLGMAGGMVGQYAAKKGDKWMGALGGAMSGASIGMAGGWVGALVGAILGAIAGYFSTAGDKKVGVRAGINYRERTPEALIRDEEAKLAKLEADFQAYLESDEYKALPEQMRKRIKENWDRQIEAQQKVVEDLKAKLASGQFTSFNEGEFFTDISGPGDEQERQYARQLRDRYRQVTIGIRSLFAELGAALPDWKDISAEWHDEVADFGEWWKKLLAHDLPQVILQAYLPELRAALLGSAKLKGAGGVGANLGARLDQELKALSEAPDWDAALQRFQSWMRAVVQMSDLATELGRGTAGMKEDALRNQMDTFRKAAQDTGKELERLGVDLDKMTTEEQVARAQEFADAIEAQLDINRKLIASIENARKSIRETFGAIGEDIAKEAADKAGTTASVEFSRGKLAQAMKKLADAGDPAALQDAAADVAKWIGHLREAKAAIEEEMAARREELAAIQEARDYLAETSELLSKPFEAVVAELRRNPTEAWAAGFASATAEIAKLKEGLANLSPKDLVDRLKQIGDLQRRQYQENLAYLKDVLAAQQEVTASHDAFWSNIEEQEAKKKGAEAYGQLMVDRIQEAMEALRTTTDPAEIRRLNQQILEWAGKLNQVNEERMKEGGWLGVQVGPGVEMNVLQWLQMILPQVEELAGKRLEGQVDTIEDANEALANSLIGLGDILDDEQADIQAALDALAESLEEIDTLINEALATGLETAEGALDAWTLEVEESTRALLEAITGQNGIGTALTRAAGAQSINTEAITSNTAAFDAATSSVWSLRDAADQAAAALGRVQGPAATITPAGTGAASLVQQVRRGAVRLYGGGVG